VTYLCSIIQYLSCSEGHHQHQLLDCTIWSSFILQLHSHYGSTMSFLFTSRGVVTSSSFAFLPLLYLQPLLLISFVCQTTIKSQTSAGQASDSTRFLHHLRSAYRKRCSIRIGHLSAFDIWNLDSCSSEGRLGVIY